PPPGIVVAVAHLRPSRVTVRHHPARVLRVIRESAHLRIAAVIYRQQFTGFRIRVPRQWRTVTREGRRCATATTIPGGWWSS
ncbi:hypothetical protein, partial [Escherichia coli]|uniref:hypothetical protein n=1 Tax=Escherichia coli TaxID=562 RepID=UPI003F4ACF3C